MDIPLEKAENYKITDPRLKRENKRIKKPKPEEHREQRDQAQATIQKAVISKFAEKCETINIDLLVIEVPTKATTSTIAPVMFKVIEDTSNKPPPRSTHNFKVQQEEMQKSVITPFEETIEAQGTDENFNITPIGSTSGEEEKTSGNTELREIAKTTKLQHTQEDIAILEPTATTSQNTGPRSTLEQDAVILQVIKEEDQEFPEELNNLINSFYPIDNEIAETRKVYLNNDWQITDTIGNPDFIGLIENNSNKDLLSFITEKLPY